MSVQHKAKRRLGQNFLVKSQYCEQIVAAVGAKTGETVLEIGPGHGALTELLVETGARIVAIEVDRDLIPSLNRSFASRNNFSLIEADALEVDFCQAIAPAATACVVANLPYYISSPIMQRLIEHRRCVSEMTLMLQREVVERITASPGGKEYGYLSVLVQLYCEAESLFDVPPTAFRPVPKVVSSVVKLKVRPQPAAVVSDEKLFFELTKTLFAQRRKTIHNNLRSGWTRLGIPAADQIGEVLASAELDPQRRAETLTIVELARLADKIQHLN
jgi:16S rRNA (adenine1518-N6/adenine1519-N6)-dimethyltransferase